MINVLPQNEKSALHKEYILRLVTLCLFIFSAFSFSATFLLMPAYVLSADKINALEIQLQKYNASNDNKPEDNLFSIIGEINKNLEILNKDSKNKNITEDIFGTVFSARTKGIKILSISYFISPEGKDTAQINGQALDRLSLRAYEEGIKKDKRVESTNLPVSNFTKRANIDFSLTVSFK